MAKLGRWARVARLTWINRVQAFPTSLAAGVRVAIDCLSAGEAFQKFDSTIVKVLGSLSCSWGQVPVGTSTLNLGIAAYLYVADEALALANFPAVETEATQAAYLWTYFRAGRLHRVTDGSLVDTADATENWWERLDVDAQRRFRENNKTLYLVVKNTSTNATVLIEAYVRTLVRIP